MLELINVTKVYQTKAGDTAALNNVSVRFNDTGMVFITGKSGSGKTTFLNVIGGLDDFDSGEIIINGKKFSTFSPQEYDSYRNTFIGFIFQEYNLLPDYTVEKNLKIANELQGKETDPNVVSKLLEDFDIGGYEQRKPNQLSGGQKQRVAIARSLIKNPKIIMADEPTGALDSITGVQVMETLKKLSKNKLVIIVSHDLELAEKYADRIIRLIDGKIVEDVTLNDVQITSNVLEEDDTLLVKTGVKLTKEEAKAVITALEENKKISIQEELSTRKREKTKPIARPEKEEQITFIKSKMKYKSTAELGLKSLKVKPGRLVFTIILSVIAFAVFGLFDTIAAYSDTRSINNLLKAADYQALAVEKQYDGGNYSNAGIRLTKEEIEKYADKSGYDFRPVYDMKDNKQFKDMNETVYVNHGLSTGVVTVGAMYYLKYVNGFVEFSPDEIVINEDGTQTIDPDGFNVKVIAGTYPILSHEDGKIISGSLRNIAISKYLAESIAIWEEIEGGYMGVLNEKIKIRDIYYTVSAIVDCGAIPQKYHPLASQKPIANTTNALADDFETYLNSSLHLSVMVPTGYVECLRKDYERQTCYYSGDVAYTVKINPGSYTTRKVGNFAKFYSHSDIAEDKVILFNNPSNSTSYALKEGEVLLNIHQLRLLYENENSYLTKHESAFGSAYSTLTAEFNESLKILETAGKVSATKERREAMTTFLNVINSILDKMYPETTEKPDKNPGFLRDIEIECQDKTTKPLKVVGCYLGVDIDQNTPNLGQSAMYPMVMHPSDMEDIGVYAEQGDYGKMIAPLVKNAKGARYMSKVMTTESGVILAWVGNSVLNTIKQNGKLISQFSQLFLYVALVLALFSVFMLFNYISTSIASKRQSIGVLRALGSGGKDIFKMFITESMAIAITDGILASGVAALGCIFVNNYIKNIMNLTLDFALFGIRQIILIMLASIVTAILSSIIPIVKIAKEKPVKLIREP